jgi:hypothetical protein
MTPRMCASVASIFADPSTAPGPNGSGVDGTKAKWARPRHARSEPLFSQIEPSDDLLIPGAVFARQVFEQLISPAHELEQPTA